MGDEGRYWNRVCQQCPKQEVVAPEDVPEEWLQGVRDEVTARVLSRRHLGDGSPRLPPALAFSAIVAWRDRCTPA